MNRTMNWSAIAGLLLALPASAAEEKSSWEEVFPVDAAPHVVISNVWGNIRVRPGSDGAVTINATERRWAPSAEQLEMSRDLLWLDINVTPQTVALEIEGTHQHHKRAPGCRGCRLEFQFDVLVPPDANLSVSTVNDGAIDVQGIAGIVSASNVNGPVTVHDMANCDEIQSVNGEVKLSFVTQPTTDCRLDTINGDITATLPAGVGLDLAVELFNGRIISAMDVTPVALAANVKQTSTGTGTRYEIEKPAGLRLGKGGPRFELESLNGDVRIGITP